MRLLECRQGKFKLTKYFVHDTPRYAILSHTWGHDAEEVTFKDLVDGTGQDKIGYEKIRFCAEQSRRDGLEYFWIDTCCIDKSNNNELSTAINSMFRWYQNATRCYVYLSDILAGTCCHGQQCEFAWESAFQTHRWFTRGWTLQELLAPASVEFFTQDGLRLGDKKSLEQQIHKSTGIAIEALRGKDPSQFNVEERFKWAEKRQTTHEEDWAYCLLGIFGVFMPPIYGEGKEHAIRRLKREIDAKGREDSSNRQGGTLLTRLLTTSLMVDWKWRPFLCVLIIGLAMLVKQEVTRRDLSPSISRPAAVYLTNQQRPGSDLKQTALIPYTRNPDFVGRSRIFEQLKSEFGYCQPQGDVPRHKRVALFGLGGIGKTQIALAYVHWLQEKCPEVSIYWVHASSVERINQSFSFIAQKLQVPGYDDPKVDVVLLVKRWLERVNGQWLMVVDNADDPHLFSQPVESQSTSTFGKQGTLGRYLPDSTHGSILVTTRNKQAATRLCPGRRQIEVSKMEEIESELLLRTRIEGHVTSDELSELSSRLEHLPLALVQAAAFIQENTISVKEYIQLLSQSDENLIDLLSEEFDTVGRDLEASRAVAKTWVLSFEQIHQLNPFASELLSLISFLDRHAIPLEFLSFYDKSQKEPKGEILLAKAIGMLKAFSFVSQGRGHTLDMHRLVQLVTRAWLAKKNMASHFAGKALLAVTSSYPSVNTLGSFFYLRYRWAEAEEFQVQAVTLRRRLLGSEHSETLASMASLASAYSDQGRRDEAEKLLLQVVETSASVCSAHHPNTLASMNNLAPIYFYQGQWQEAERLTTYAMDTRKVRLGEHHPDTLMTLDNLSSLYMLQGRWEDAENLLLHVVATFMVKLGEDHPYTLTTMYSLALIWNGQGRSKQALSMMERCAQRQRRVLGESHPLTKRSLSILAKWL